jgi:C-terminal processing protease CtpA/Prc
VDKEVNIKLVSANKRPRYWDERFFNNTYLLKEEQFNDKAFIERFYSLENSIGYIQLPDMVTKETSSVFFEYLADFMTAARQSEALIIDVRDNGGGTRDLIQDLAGYFIHPDSVYVVNVTKQRRDLPLNQELSESLHSRFLFSKAELDHVEQRAVSKFMDSFTPMYELDTMKFSEYYYYVLNGEKISKDKYH